MYELPVEPYSASDKSTFAYESTVKRWPRILTQIIDELNSRFDECRQDGQLKEAKALIAAIAALKYEITHNKEVPPLDDDDGPNIEMYNAELLSLRERQNTTWFQMPWLFAECYMYRRLRVFFAQTSHWTEYDPFAKQKIDTFASAAPGVFALALNLNELVQAAADTKDPEDLHPAFLELAQVALWGNATDLSLLQNLSHADIQALQKTGRSAQQEAEHLILANDLAAAWEHLSGLKNERIDIVLDNAGFELYGDLVFADWLLSTPFCNEIVFHPKDIPWFVSDVLPADFENTFNALADPEFFKDASGAPAADEDHQAALAICLSRWKTHFTTGRFKSSIPVLGSRTSTMALDRNNTEAYWTNPLPFAIIPDRSPALLRELQQASLVIFKGDLNYRKLTSDARWDHTTPFNTALGPLAGQINLLSLRTLKADVCVGLPAGTAERLDREDPTWRVSGKYAVMSFSKAA